MYAVCVRYLLLAESTCRFFPWRKAVNWIFLPIRVISSYSNGLFGGRWFSFLFLPRCFTYPILLLLLFLFSSSPFLTSFLYCYACYICMLRQQVHRAKEKARHHTSVYNQVGLYRGSVCNVLRQLIKRINTKKDGKEREESWMIISLYTTMSVRISLGTPPAAINQCSPYLLTTYSFFLPSNCIPSWRSSSEISSAAYSILRTTYIWTVSLWPVHIYPVLWLVKVVGDSTHYPQFLTRLSRIDKAAAKLVTEHHPKIGLRHYMMS